MIRKITLIAPVILLGACSMSCSDQFTRANGHLIDTAQVVYESKIDGDITPDKALRYQDTIENAYKLTVDGSLLCDINEDAAADKFEQAEDILNAIDEALAIETHEDSTNKGE